MNAPTLATGLAHGLKGCARPGPGGTRTTVAQGLREHEPGAAAWPPFHLPRPRFGRIRDQRDDEHDRRSGQFRDQGDDPQPSRDADRAPEAGVRMVLLDARGQELTADLAGVDQGQQGLRTRTGRGKAESRGRACWSGTLRDSSSG